LRKQQEQERRQREETERRQREEQARQRAAQEAERQRQAQEEARRRQEAQNTRDQIGGLFGSGSGKGNTGKPGNQGDPNGDPNSGNLEGISKGSGRVGGGLGNRGVVRSPSITETFQKTGTVVVEVCVNANGDVTRADLKLAGTTTQDAQLVNAAKANARQWKFSAGQVDSQCGTITYNFRVQ
jgi:TonB family protein